MSSHGRSKKSSLTQQQRNKKRQRATSAQLAILKREFLINPTPNAKAREEIGERIDMTERSVQIWFQNKRAKAKLYARKQGVYPDHDSLFGRPNNKTYEYGQYYAHKKSPGDLASTDGQDSDSIICGNNDQSLTCSKIPILARHIPEIPLIRFSCIKLTIGNWQWMAMDSETNLDGICQAELNYLGQATNNSFNGPSMKNLLVYYSPPESLMTYELVTKGKRIKILIHTKAISKISLNTDERNNSLGHIIIKLSGGPHFAVNQDNSNIWTEYSDFSEDKEISRTSTHILTGYYTELQCKLFDLYSFQPSKVSSQLMTPPSSATIAFSREYSLSAESDIANYENTQSYHDLHRHNNCNNNNENNNHHQLLPPPPLPKNKEIQNNMNMTWPQQSQLWLDQDAPERNQTQSTPAVLIQNHDKDRSCTNTCSSLLDSSYLFESLSDNNDELISPMWDNELLIDLRRNSQFNVIPLSESINVPDGKCDNIAGESFDRESVNNLMNMSSQMINASPSTITDTMASQVIDLTDPDQSDSDLFNTNKIQQPLSNFFNSYFWEE